jgi:hypothetical protein
MRWSLFAALSISSFVLPGMAVFAAAGAPEGIRISGPHSHDNLTVFFIHGASTPGKVPLTLEEALAKRVVQVRETGNVNQLDIENLGSDAVFIQAGDIVKGGQQDRTLVASLLLPPKSGRIPIDSFCVEQGRWSARGKEDVKNFASAAGHVPSREMKIAMQAPPVAAPRPTAGADTSTERRIHTQRTAPASDTGERQRKVWEGVSKVHKRLEEKVGAPVTSPQSASSLQLSLENKKVIAAKQAYVDALRAPGEAQADIVGYVFAINGKIASADVYASNGLFRKMWTKLLDAGATEAIGQRSDTPAAAPSIEEVTAFLAGAERGKASEKLLTAGLRLQSRDGEQAYLFETVGAKGFLHRNYLAK